MASVQARQAGMLLKQKDMLLHHVLCCVRHAYIFSTRLNFEAQNSENGGKCCCGGDKTVEGPPPRAQATSPLPSFHFVLLSRNAQARHDPGELGTTCGAFLKNLRAGTTRPLPPRLRGTRPCVSAVFLLCVCELKAVY